jgi:hypothetical protein
MIHRPGDVAPISAYKVVDNSDLGNTRGNKLIDDGTPDETGAAGYEAACAR